MKNDLTHALQKRDIEELTTKVSEGFKGVHERQDKTNGKVGANGEAIVELKKWRAFITGGLAVLTILVIPILLYLITQNI